MNVSTALLLPAVHSQAWSHARRPPDTLRLPTSLCPGAPTPLVGLFCSRALVSVLLWGFSFFCFLAVPCSFWDLGSPPRD